MPPFAPIHQRRKKFWSLQLKVSVAFFIIQCEEIEDHFSITTSIVVSPAFYGWVFGLGGKAIIEDSGEEDSVAKKYLNYIETIKEIQQKSIE